MFPVGSALVVRELLPWATTVGMGLHWGQVEAEEPELPDLMRQPTTVELEGLEQQTLSLELLLLALEVEADGATRRLGQEAREVAELEGLPAQMEQPTLVVGAEAPMWPLEQLVVPVLLL